MGREIKGRILQIAAQSLCGARAFCLVFSLAVSPAPVLLAGSVSVFALGATYAHADDGGDSGDSGGSDSGDSGSSDGGASGSGDSGSSGDSSGDSSSGSSGSDSSGSDSSGSGSSGSGGSGSGSPGSGGPGPGGSGEDSGGHREREGSGSGYSVSGFLNALKSHGRVEETDHGAHGSFSVRYSDGWTERLQGGTYELIDRSGRVVVSRPARTLDEKRLDAAEKSKSWSRRGQ